MPLIDILKFLDIAKYVADNHGNSATSSLFKTILTKKRNPIFLKLLKRILSLLAPDQMRLGVGLAACLSLETLPSSENSFPEGYQI